MERVLNNYFRIITDLQPVMIKREYSQDSKGNMSESEVFVPIQQYMNWKTTTNMYVEFDEAMERLEKIKEPYIKQFIIFTKILYEKNMHRLKMIKGLDYSESSQIDDKFAWAVKVLNLLGILSEKKLFDFQAIFDKNMNYVGSKKMTEKSMATAAHQSYRPEDNMNEE